MEDFCSVVKNKLDEYGYEIYHVAETKNEDEICIMTESMMLFVNDKDKSITISFEYTLEPENVARNMMVLNEVDDIEFVYVSESFVFDPETKKYVVGNEAKKIAYKRAQVKIMKEFTKDQVYSHILATQRCHEC
jgi:hypothetical protein